MAFPAHFEPSIAIGLDITANQPTRHITLFQHDPLALVGERQLGADIALLALAADLLQPIRSKVQRPMQIVRPGRDNGKLLVIVP